MLSPPRRGGFACVFPVQLGHFFSGDIGCYDLIAVPATVYEIPLGVFASYLPSTRCFDVGARVVLTPRLSFSFLRTSTFLPFVEH